MRGKYYEGGLKKNELWSLELNCKKHTFFQGQHLKDFFSYLTIKQYKWKSYLGKIQNRHFLNFLFTFVVIVCDSGTFEKFSAVKSWKYQNKVYRE